MTALRFGLGLAATLLTLASSLPAGDDKKPTLAGEWEVVSMSKEGKVAPKEQLENVLIRGSAETIVPVMKKEQKEDESSRLEYKFISPKEIDLLQKVKVVVKGGEPADAISIRRGIYEFAGDTVKLCWSEGAVAKKGADGKIEIHEKAAPRPTTFDGGRGIVSLVLKRKAK